MSGTETKQKILDVSRVLFNGNGITNVRLQDIGDEAGISTGNLAYHFTNKEAIADALIEQAVEILGTIGRNYGKHPALRDLDAFFIEFYEHCALFKFLFYDTLEIKRAFPLYYDPLQSLFSKLKLQIDRRLEQYSKNKFLLPHLSIKAIAADLWLIIYFMNTDAELMSKRPISQHVYRRRLWEHIARYFTANGRTEFANTVELDLKSR